MSKESYSYDSLKNKWRLGGISLLEFFGLLFLGFCVALFWYSHIQQSEGAINTLVMIIVAIVGMGFMISMYSYILRVPTITNYYLGLNKYRDVVLYDRNKSYRF